jgi:alkaline phosphatase
MGRTSMKRTLVCGWALVGASLALAATTVAAQDGKPAAVAAAPRSAVFLHPDGMGVNVWGAVRLKEVGPDGRLAWDRLPRVAIYIGPMIDGVTASSNGGATTHAWGVRARTDSYGMIGDKPIMSSGAGTDGTLMTDAKRAGKAVGIVNSSSVTEPGTGAFLAKVDAREDENEIAAQILAARPDVILGGGEAYFLPRGVRGLHGEGLRTDGRNLIDEARAAGYTVVRTKAEFEALPADATRVLGLFAREETFNEADEATLKRRGLGVFQPQAPRFEDMIRVALRILSKSPNGFFLAANDETTDNLAGENNASAVLEAGAGADRAITAVLEYAARDPLLTLVVTSDSDCGGMQVSGDEVPAGARVPARNENGAPQDGLLGRPFMAAPDAQGQRHPFIVHWASANDVSGGIAARGIGPGAERLYGTIDSKDIYWALHEGLFGRSSPKP